LRDETSNGADDTTSSKVEPVVSATHNDGFEEPPTIDKVKFHSTPTSPISENKPVLKSEAEPQDA
jgi:hypothetical protein